MALPSFNLQRKKKDQLLAVDLGSRTTKAIHLQSVGDGLSLMRYAVLDAPVSDKAPSPELLAEHLKSVGAALNAKTKLIALSLGVSETVVRSTELPQVPVGDMRQIVKNSPKAYLQQDLPNHVFDCYCVPTRQDAKAAQKLKPGMGGSKQKVLVAGAKSQVVYGMQTAARNAGFIPDSVIPALIAPVNAFEMAMPEVFAKEVVALVDIGFKNSSICLLQEGELILSRVVGIGGDKLTEGLAEALGTSYAEAEGIKVGMPHEVLSSLEVLVRPLGRELRALIDFFEHQQDRQVGQVFVCGGTARSDCILEILQTELMVECKRWNPVANIRLSLPPEQVAEVEQVTPQLAVAVGCAAATL